LIVIASITIQLSCLASAVALGAHLPSRDVAAAALKTGEAQRAVHYVSTTVLGSVQVRQVADVTADSGIQQITLHNGNEVGRVTVIVANRTVYVRATAAFVLSDYYYGQ
jgi:hypothetical protein